jgi:hypothetical protein
MLAFLLTIVVINIGTADAACRYSQGRSDNSDNPHQSQAGPQRPQSRRLQVMPCPADSIDHRTNDGTCNNMDFHAHGSTETPLIRRAGNSYTDGISSIPSDRANPREISNAVSNQGDRSILNDMNASDFLWLWGQFIDHDITEVHLAGPAEYIGVKIPKGDAFFDPGDTG